MLVDSNKPAPFGYAADIDWDDDTSWGMDPATFIDDTDQNMEANNISDLFFQSTESSALSNNPQTSQEKLRIENASIRRRIWPMLSALGLVKSPDQISASRNSSLLIKPLKSVVQDRSLRAVYSARPIQSAQSIQSSKSSLESSQLAWSARPVLPARFAHRTYAAEVPEAIGALNEDIAIDAIAAMGTGEGTDQLGEPVTEFVDNRVIAVSSDRLAVQRMRSNSEAPSLTVISHRLGTEDEEQTVDQKHLYEDGGALMRPGSPSQHGPSKSWGAAGAVGAELSGAESAAAGDQLTAAPLRAKDEIDVSWLDWMG